ncbi:peptide chain release factor 3 [Bacillus luteolus]|uniref:Peptide chain release factor 3 n=1 Tax=Litchfieldia luteola TaxID=682179 RepID=A0ABR9QED4_9BACI|nr:peptide chain release factor 3 [Cytobacillus luteolus]MBE4906864.1 peptide chain release factor 3 [Cytobacillus luteolus]MBP1940481.1 peptide chain release factor 3 [Cytobacillus luteolus]
MSLNNEVSSRRTFAIISHPDAGKTTMTEKLLLFGNVIREAGTVKGKKTGKFAASDWMEIEKKRGISVTSSVMSFPYHDFHVNILDTPGHEDFSEDTYRTLTAVDSVVMIIDSTKGVEPQTIKLFKVCRMRGIPIFTFINKLDRDGKEPLELLSELEEVLGIESYPMNWPVGMGKGLLGIWDRYNSEFVHFLGDEKEERMGLDEVGRLGNDSLFDSVRDDLSLLDEAGNQFDAERVIAGELTPVFFGSALANFGVRSFFDTFLNFASPPRPRKADEGLIPPNEENFSGYIFKIQANMNPAHRDRIAFLRVCSGKFQRGMSVQVSRTGKSIKLNQTQQFMAASRETVEEAYAGDIIGIYDPNIYQIGDTLTEGKDPITYRELPQFPPEIFRKVRVKNAMKGKQFKKGIEQLVQEGAIQLFKQELTDEYILGAVGQLQFEVFEYRMKGEYGVDIEFTQLGDRIPRWLTAPPKDRRLFDSRSLLVQDRHDRFAVLFENDFTLRYFTDKNKDIELVDLLESNDYKSL